MIDDSAPPREEASRKDTLAYDRDVNATEKR